MAKVRGIIAAAALGLASCAYDPPMRADHTAPAYRKALGDCQATGDKEAERRVMARGGLFLTYPVSLPILQRVETRKCLEGKGYKLES